MLRELKENENFRLFDFDITQHNFLSTFSMFPIKEIYHLACPTGVPNIKTMGARMMTTCSTGTENALKLALETNAKLVYTSSCEVYGDPMVSPQTEDYTGNVSTIGPRSAYEEAKRMGETWVRLYQENYAVNAKVVRIFNTYGEGMHIEDTRVIPSFMRNIKQGKPVVIYGNGEQQRTHMHVDDLVNGLQTVLHEGQAGEAYNIGGVNPISIKQLADIFRELVDDNIEIHYKQHFI